MSSNIWREKTRITTSINSEAKININNQTLVKGLNKISELLTDKLPFYLTNYLLSFLSICENKSI